MCKATIWDTAGKVKIFIIVVMSPKFLAHHHNHHGGSVRYSLGYYLRHFEDEKLYNNHHQQQIIITNNVVPSSSPSSWSKREISAWQLFETIGRWRESHWSSHELPAWQNKCSSNVTPPGNITNTHSDFTFFCKYCAYRSLSSPAIVTNILLTWPIWQIFATLGIHSFDSS